MPQIYLKIFFCKFWFSFNFVIVSQYVYFLLHFLRSYGMVSEWTVKEMCCHYQPSSSIMSLFSCVQYILKTANMPLYEVQKEQLAMVGEIFHSCLSFPPPIFWPLENDAVWQKNTHIWINVLTVEPSRLVLVYLLFSGNPRPQLRTILAFFLTSIIIIAWKKTSKARDVISLDLQIRKYA